MRPLRLLRPTRVSGLRFAFENRAIKSITIRMTNTKIANPILVRRSRTRGRAERVLALSPLISAVISGYHGEQMGRQNSYM